MEKIKQSYPQHCNRILKYSLMEKIISFRPSGNKLHKLTLILGKLFLKDSGHNGILELCLIITLEYRIKQLELKKIS